MGYSSHWISRTLSFIHACIVGGLAVYLLATLPKETLWNPGIIDSYAWGAMFCITCCYLLFDCIMMVCMPSQGDLLWIVHHIVGGFGIFFIWWYNNVWLLGLFFELTELSTIFLNITWAYVHYKWKKTIIFHVCAFMLMITYFVIRWIGGVFMFYYIYDHHEYVWSLPLFRSVYVYFGTITIFILNIIWGIKLLVRVSQQIKELTSEPEKKPKSKKD